MSTTTQEPLVAPEEPTETEKEKEKEKASSTREYVILEQRNQSWTEVKRVTATDVEGALNTLGDDLKQNTKYVAVAERYWRPATPRVETHTVVTLMFDD